MPIKDFNKAFANRVDLFVDTWAAGGFNAPTQERWSFMDLMAVPNAAVWMPKVTEYIMREPVEPRTIIPQILENVPFDPSMRYTFPAIGALVAYDMAESETYREQQLQIAPGSVTINVGKSGLMFKISDELRRWSQFDIINMHLRAARRALDRHKERKGFDFISALGTRLYDNVNPTTSVYGTCTGRNLVGAGNGSCRMEDLLNAYSFIMMQGFSPDTLLMHPMAWSIWMADPMLKSIVKNTGQGLWFQRHNMAQSSLPWRSASQNAAGIHSGYGQFTPSGNAASATATSTSTPGVDQTLNSPAVVPDYFPYPLRVIVSPYVPFNENNNTTDIIMFDSGNLGALFIAESPTTEQWEDMNSDILKVKVRERYGFYVYEEGLAVGVMKNVAIAANEIALPVQPTISTAGSLAELDVTTAITGL